MNDTHLTNTNFCQQNLTELGRKTIAKEGDLSQGQVGSLWPASKDLFGKPKILYFSQFRSYDSNWQRALNFLKESLWLWNDLVQ